MEDLTEKADQCDNQARIVNDDVLMEESTSNDNQENLSTETKSINGSRENENQGSEESKTDGESLKKEVNGKSTNTLDDELSSQKESLSKFENNTSVFNDNKDQGKSKDENIIKSVENEMLVDDQTSTKENKLDSKENATNESEFKDEFSTKNDLNKSDHDDLNKDYTEKDESTSPKSESGNLACFKKVESKIKKRNYRSQQNSMDVNDDSSDHEKSSEKNDEDSNSSSDSIESDERKRAEDNSDSRRRAVDSSDTSSDAAGGIDDADSMDTSASDDDDDEMPAVLQKEPSKSNYSIVKDIINRQIGSNNFLSQRFYSSLHVVQRFELMSKLEEHTGCVNSLGFNTKGNLLASGSDDLTIAIWDWALGKKCLSLETGHRSNVFQSKWLPLDGENFLVSSARDGQVRLIDITSKVTRRLAQHRLACHKISTHMDLPHIVLSAGEDSRVLSIDVRDGKPTRLLSVCEEDNQAVEIYSIHSNPLNNCEFCVAGRMRNVLVYDRRKLSDPLHKLCPKHLLSDDNAHLTCAVYNNNGTEIVGSYYNEDIYLFDVGSSYQSGDFAHKYQGHRNSATVKGVNFFGPNSEFILSGSDCGNIFIWDKKTEAIVQWMPGDEHGIVNVLEPHPHIPILATSGMDYDVKIWIPSRESTPNIKQKLQSCVKRNLAARTRVTREADSAFDGHILWIMLRHIRQQERPRTFLNRNRIRNDDTSDEYSNSDEGNENDHDDENNESSDD